MKRLLLGFVLLLLLLAAAGAFLLTRLDTGFVAATLSDAVRAATGAPVTFADAPRLSFIPLGVKFGRLSWQQEQPDRSLAVSAAGGHASVALSPLLSGRIVVKEIVLTEPSLTVALRAPAADAVPPTPAAPPADRPPSAAAAGAPSDELPLELGQIRVEKARISLTDAAGNRCLIDNLHLNLQNVRRHADMTLDTAFSCSLTQDGKSLSGSVALATTLRYVAPTLTLRNLQLGLTQQTGPLPANVGPLALRGEAALNLATRKLRLQNVALSGASSHAELSGEADLAALNFAGTLSLTTAPRALAALWDVRLPPQKEDRLELSTGLECSPDRLALRQLKASLDTTRLEGSLAIALRPEPDIRGSLHLGDVVLDAWLPEKTSAANAVTAAPAGHAAPLPAERAAATPAPASALPALDLGLNVDSLRYRTMGLLGVALRLQGADGRYSLRDFRARLLSGGDLNGSGTFDLPQKSYGLGLTAENVDIGGLAHMLGKGRPAEGKARLTADLVTRGDDADAMLAALDGKGALDVRDLHLQALSALPRDIPGVSGAIPNRIGRVQVPFVIRQGEVTAKPIVASADTLAANGQATASLPRRRLHATADVRTLGLTIPVIVEGPFDALSYTVDPRFLERMAAGLPGALLKGGEQAGRTAGEAARDAGSALDKTVRGAGGLVRGILGR